MTTREREVILGGVIFGALIILIVGIVWLSERYAGVAGDYRLTVTFDSAAGLGRGTHVTVRGVWVGKILSVSIERGRPMVEIGLDQDLIGGPLPRDSRVLVKSEGLLGGQMIEIQIGKSGEVYQYGDLVIGMSESSLKGLSASAADLAGQMEKMMGVLSADPNLAHIENVLGQMDRSTRELQGLLQENRDALSAGLDSLAGAAAQASGILHDNREGIRQTIDHADAATERLATASANIEAASASLQEMLQNLNEVSRKLREGEGTLGRLVSDEQLYLDLRGTVARVDSLLEAVNRDPSRYLNFRFTLF